MYLRKKQTHFILSVRIISIRSPLLGEKELENNYCSTISLTCMHIKLMESIVKDEILLLMINNNLLADLQHGFVPEKPC